MTTEEARARIDEKIAKHTLMLCNLRARRNTLSPIFRLPPETLETIFIHIARNDGEHYTPNWDVPSWVGVSYVCRHWRDVALNFPTLWTYHFVVSLRWTEELLARSKEASLKIRIVCDTLRRRFWWTTLVEKLMDHAERIQEFYLDLSTLYFHQILSKLSSRAPRLQNLVILMGHGFGQEYPMLFDGDTPVLRTLELSECPVPWYSFKLSGLTTLSLHTSSVPWHFQQGIVEFLAVLGRMQGLTCLYLHQTLASAREFISSPAFDAFQKINLPHLSRFLVAAPLSTVVALLSCVDIPFPKAQVRIECMSEDESSLDDFIQLSSLFAREFGPSEDQARSILTIRSLAIGRSQGVTTFAFSASERDCNPCDSTSHVNWDRNTPLEIIVHLCDLLPWLINTIQNDIYCTMFLSTVESVHVIKPTFESPALWRRALGRLRQLRYIKLSRGLMLGDFASALSVSNHEGPGNQGGRATSDRGPEHILVPALEELKLYRITILPDTQRSLLNALSTRKGTRSRLTMSRCLAPGGGFDAVYLWDGTRLHEVVESGIDHSDSLEGDSDMGDDDG